MKTEPLNENSAASSSPPAGKSSGISLSSAPLKTSLVVILALGILTSTLLTFNEHQAYSEHIANLRSNFNEQYRNRVREELKKAVTTIEHQRSLTSELVEDEIRRKVQSAYTIASHFYRMYRDEMSPSEMRSKVVEVLRPIRWSNDRGYYIAGRIQDNIFDLFADEPSLEGQPLDVLRDARGGRVGEAMVTLARDTGAGLLLYDVTEHEPRERMFSKIAFVKYFDPFDWFIGAEVFREDLERSQQSALLKRIRQMRFSRDGTITVLRRDGTIISHADERYIGRSVEDLTDAAGVSYGEVLRQIALDKPGGDYFEFSYLGEDDAVVHHKLGFVMHYRDWDWILCACMSMDDMEKTIGDQTTTYRRIATKNLMLFLILFGLAVTLLLVSSYVYSLKIKKGVNLFTDFFRQAVEEKIKIKKTDMTFAEFVDLGHLANRMIDDLVLHEARQRRNELRLDALLQLGSMHDLPLTDKYNFILQRMMHITRSEGGYLTLLDETHNTLTLCSLFWLNDQGEPREVEGLPQIVTKTAAGLPGEVMRQQEFQLCNTPGLLDSSSSWPYTGVLRRHLDVPLVHGDKIVLVAGVCNSDSDYDTGDARQMLLLLEGLWLHVLNTTAEEEKAQLERQIIAVSEQERSSIGRDLHDDLGSHLSGVELLSKALQKRLEQEAPKHAGQLGIIRDLIRESIDKTRRLAHGLYPVHIIEQGLEASVEELTAEIENLFQVQCEYSFDDTIEWADNSTATQVYCIIREAVFNAARHGRPRNIAIVTKTLGELLTVTISDDGCGFTPEDIRGGIGLHTMRYRARAIGASLNVVSREHYGTIITLSGEVLFA